METLKSISWIGAVAAAFAGAVWSFLTYEDKTRLEFQQPMVTKTIELCFEVSKLTGDMVSDNGQHWSEDRAHFWSLYHGQLVLVENNELASAMVEYGNAVTEMTEAAHKNNSQLALHVSGACRKLIDSMMATKWKLDPSAILNPTVITAHEQGDQQK